MITQLKLKNETLKIMLPEKRQNRNVWLRTLRERRKLENKLNKGKIQAHQKPKENCQPSKQYNKRRKDNKRHKPKVQEDKKGNFDTLAPSQQLEFKYDVVKGIVELGVDVPDKIEDIQATIE